uniref:UMP-CMP kinase n=1 Tax=Caligus clemensi TaxID=344056 RepID=C1C2H9_CALCM|nr:UMP-CMP kinase [Caligus clemensi]
MSQFDVVFVLGGPGAGKGTQCAKIVEKYGFVHLSAGELLREEQKKEDSEFSNIIQHHMISGSIVPAYITCALLKNAMVNSKSSKRFLIDGFPRNRDNVDEWESRIAPLVNFRFVLFSDCDKDTCVKRCLQRGAQGSGRLDDNSTTLEKRFDTYLKSTKVIIDTYDSSRQVQQVDASKDIESIFSQVQIIMDDAFLHKS